MPAKQLLCFNSNRILDEGAFKPPVAKAAVHSKAEVLLLTIHYLLLLPLFVLLCLFGPFLLLSTLCPSSVAITLMGKREMVAWLKLCLMSCDY